MIDHTLHQSTYRGYPLSLHATLRGWSMLVATPDNQKTERFCAETPADVLQLVKAYVDEREKETEVA